MTVPRSVQIFIEQAIATYAFIITLLVVVVRFVPPFLIKLPAWDALFAPALISVLFLLFFSIIIADIFPWQLDDRLAPYFAIGNEVAMLCALAPKQAWSVFTWLMLSRPLPTESHILSFTVVGLLVIYAAWQRSFKYGVLLGVYAIWSHEVYWWLLYGLQYGGTAYWFLFVQMGCGIYLTLRVYPALLKLSGYRFRYKMLAAFFVPYFFYGLWWLSIGLPVSNYFSATNGTILLQGVASPFFNNLFVNGIENFSWIIVVVSAAVVMHFDSARGIPFTVEPTTTTTESSRSTWFKFLFSGVALAVLLVLWGHSLGGWFPAAWLNALMQGTIYAVLVLAIVYFFLIAIPRPKPS